MSKRGAPGIGVQLNMTLKAISGRGVSKKDTKEKYRHNMKQKGERANPLKSPLIHSDKYMQNIRTTSELYLRWAKEKGFGHKHINQYNHAEAGRKFFEERIARGVKDLSTEVGHLRKLEDALKTKWGAEVKIVPEDVSKMLREAGYPTTRAGRIARQTTYRRYCREEVQKGLAQVRGQRSGGVGKADALEAQYRLGFRAQEAVCLRVRHVDLDRGRIYVCEGQKGTRTRFIPIPVEYRSKLERLMEGKQPGDRVYDIAGKSVKCKERNLERAWERACHSMSIKEHRTHNLRATYACDRIVEIKDKIREFEDRGGGSRIGLYNHERWWSDYAPADRLQKLERIDERYVKCRDRETPEEREERIDREARGVLIEEMGHSDMGKLDHYIR